MKKTINIGQSGQCAACEGSGKITCYNCNGTGKADSYYYDEVAKSNDIKKFLKKYKDSGLKVNLGSIENYISSHRGEEVDYSIFDKCDVDKTYATMTPYSPYGKNDITIELEFSCQE